MEQRLAAVLAADMAGYSRLMEADEAGTIARLRTHRIELIDPAIAKTMPDLQHSVWKRVGASQSQPIDSRAWKILGSYFKPLPEGAPGAVTAGNQRAGGVRGRRRPCGLHEPRGVSRWRGIDGGAPRARVPRADVSGSS